MAFKTYKPSEEQEEHRRKHLSKALKKWWSVPENRERMIAARRRAGKVGLYERTDEIRLKMSISHMKYNRTHTSPNKGRTCSEATKRRMSRAKKKYWREQHQKDEQE